MKNYIIGIVLLLVAGFLMLDPLQWQPRAVPVDQVRMNRLALPTPIDRLSRDLPLIHFQPTPNANTTDGNASPALPVATPITLSEEKSSMPWKMIILHPSFPIMRGDQEVRLKTRTTQQRL